MLFIDFIDASTLNGSEGPAKPGGRLNRRAFLKIALVTSGAAIGGYFGPQLLDMANTSVQSLSDQMQFGAASFRTDERKIPHLLRRAGFGASPVELAYYENLGVNGATNLHFSTMRTLTIAAFRINRT